MAPNRDHHRASDRLNSQGDTQRGYPTERTADERSEYRCNSEPLKNGRTAKFIKISCVILVYDSVIE